MFKRCVLAVLVVLLSGVLNGMDLARASGGEIYYASRPDEVALYLSNIAFVRDTVMLPGGNETRVLLPPGTYPNTLMLTENGARVRNYRITPQSPDVYSDIYSSTYVSSASAYILAWDSDVAADATREVKLEYLLPGAVWTPTYDMTIIDDQSVNMSFFAEIQNSALILDETTVYLVAGRVNLEEQVDQVSQVTMNQYAVGYSNESVTLPSAGVGTVDLQHVYSLGTVSAEPGDIVYSNIAGATFAARKQIVWNAAMQQETDVIYKVRNDTDVPLAEGIVRVYQNNLFMGSDFIETTPVGSEGSVTVGSMPDVRVHRTQSREYKADASNDYYFNTVTLEISNFGTKELSLLVLDTWLNGAWEFDYSLEPERGQDNQLRWEVTVPAGESLTITYHFLVDY